MNIRALPDHPRFLARVLQVDAVATGATALLLIAGTGALAPLLRLPEALLRGAGVFLVPFVVAIALLSLRERIPSRAMAVVVAINFAWVVASIWLVVAGPVDPSLLGTVFVLVQAAAVLLFADLGWFGLRAARRTDARGSELARDCP